MSLCSKSQEKEIQNSKLTGQIMYIRVSSFSKAFIFGKKKYQFTPNNDFKKPKQNNNKNNNNKTPPTFFSFKPVHLKQMPSNHCCSFFFSVFKDMIDKNLKHKITILCFAIKCMLMPSIHLITKLKPEV